MRGVVTYRDLPGVCGSAFDPKHVRYGAYAMADGSPLVVVTAAGFASLDDHGDWICDAVPSIPWSFDLLTARGPGDIVFLGRGYQQPDWFLYRYVGGNVIRFDLPPGYEDYYISSATWVK
ncbi:MAG: hypothetical protein M5R36_29425 [Deltaproteobacteria bacterium]|nr:hypothetical protein [Deltaproteobacteria bacterium]